MFIAEEYRATNGEVFQYEVIVTRLGSRTVLNATIRNGRKLVGTQAVTVTVGGREVAGQYVRRWVKTIIEKGLGVPKLKAKPL